MPYQSTMLAPPLPPTLLIYTATEAQQEIWTAARRGDDASCAFHQSVALQLRGPLDVAALRRAVRGLGDHHEALRSRFDSSDGRVHVAPEFVINVPLDDLSALPPTERETRRQGMLAVEVETPFDLCHGPLLRARLLRLGRDHHWLTLTVHGIVCDRGSMAVLLGDLAALYSGAEPAPAEPFSAYASHAAAQATQPTYRRAEEYWRQQLAGELPTLQLPIDQARPTVRTYRSRRHDVMLDPHLVQTLKRFGARCGATFFVTLLAGYVALLHRLTGQRDLVVGIPAAGPTVADMPHVVGQRADLLPIRCRVAPEAAFTDCLQHVRGQLLDAYEHQQVSLGRLLQMLRVPHDPSRAPLVATVFNVEPRMQPRDFPFAGLAVEMYSNPRPCDGSEVSINAVEGPDRVVLECQYNADLCTPATIRDRLLSFEVLLHSIVAEPGRALDRLPLLSRAQQEHLLLQGNNPTRRSPRERTLGELLDAQPRRTPDRAAVTCGAQTITYAELHRRANRLAWHLQKLGAGRNTLIGLCVERSIDLAVGMVGILKAGATYVPLDPADPRERLHLMLAGVRVPIVVTQAALVDRLPDSVRKIVCLDRDRAVLNALPADTPPCPARSQDIAYMIPTTGAADKPNGVLVPHSAITHVLTTLADCPGLCADDVLIALAPVGFDRAIVELLAPLTVGARVVIAERDTAAEGQRLAQLIAECGATVLPATPASWRQLLAAGWEGAPALTVWSSDETLSPELLRSLHGRVRRVFNLYGTTETTGVAAVGEQSDPERVHIGRPVAGVQVYVLDEHRELVPVGVPGELYIGGAGLALGYLNRAELTAQRFIANPYHKLAGHDRDDRLYRTGDLVRWRHDGALEYLGRNDRQINLNGHRIAPAEIEAVLERHPAVRQAVVLARTDRAGDPRLVAYLVRQPGADVTSTQLWHWLWQHLPDYMVPQHLVVLDTLPLTASGRLDHARLPAPFMAKSE